MSSYVHDSYTVGDEKYIHTTDLDEIFPKNDRRYARNAKGDEYYPPFINDQPVFLELNNRKVYAKNSQGDEIYPRDPKTGAEVSIEHNGARKYARRGNQNFYYPLDEIGWPSYPVNAYSNDQTYVLADSSGNAIYGVGADGRERYAKDSQGDEFYPFGASSFATEVGKDGKSYNLYAKTKDGRVVYPTDNLGDEYYLKDPEGDDLTSSPREDITFDRYAKKQNGDEMYPQKHFTHDQVPLSFEMVLDSKYALKRDGSVVYPLDAHDNEYVLTRLRASTRVYPAGYPVNREGYTIVPKHNKKPAIIATMLPKIDPDTSLTGMIEAAPPHGGAGSYNYYLTNIKNTHRVPRSINQNKAKYKVRPLRKTTGGSAWIYYLIGFLLAIVASFFVWT